MPSSLDNCFFSGNSADPNKGYGGGLEIMGTLAVTNCAFFDCSAARGGGLCVSKASTATIVNCTFVNNQGGADGGGIGLYSATSVTVTNCVIAFSSAGPAVGGTGAITVSHGNLFGNAGGDWVGPVAGQGGTAGNISVDPAFVDAAAGDFHLTALSPCRGAGDPAAAGLPLHDIEGDPRSVAGAVDMGADQFYYHLYNMGTVLPGGSILLRVVGSPGAAVRLALGSGVSDPPMGTPHGDLFVGLPLLAQWNLPPLPPQGVLSVTAGVPSAWTAGDEFPFQALVGTWGAPRTRLTNLMMLTVE